MDKKDHVLTILFILFIIFIFVTLFFIGRDILTTDLDKINKSKMNVSFKQNEKVDSRLVTESAINLPFKVLNTIKLNTSSNSYIVMFNGTPDNATLYIINENAEQNPTIYYNFVIAE